MAPRALPDTRPARPENVVPGWCGHAFCTEWPKHRPALRTANGEALCFGELHGVLFLGNTRDSVWNLGEAYVKWSEHSVGLDVARLDLNLEEGGWHLAENVFNEMLHDALEGAFL